jgi:hypothetical protein
MAQSSKLALASLQGMLGYVNFSTGKPDPRFQKSLNDAHALLASQGSAQPWRDLAAALTEGLRTLHQAGSPAFREVEQAEAVLVLVFDHVLKAYRDHHALLLAHQSDADLFQPFFLARVFEAVLAQRSPWQETDRIVRGALKQLDDYVGYRPVAVLETRQRGEPYDQERVRPIPLFIRGAGAACGRLEPLISKALSILQGTDPAILADACFDLELLDELALDPRGYDFDHPADKRPNYCFGEWDPHHIDGKGNYRRFVLRQITLEGLWQRVEDGRGADGQGQDQGDELLFEAAAVLACTILMAAGVSGAGPTTYDSSVNLGNLIPRIAKYREAFYAALLEPIQGEHGDRLRQEMKVTRQPFGGARHHLNRYLAQQRARQMQQRHLALLFADMGLPAASRRQLGGINATSLRILTESHILLATGDLAIDKGDLALAAANLPLVENLVKRGIACGALVDPWNVLGFQGQFPRSAALEDSIRDQRIDGLVYVIGRLFNLFARLMSEAAASGSFTVGAGLAKDMRRLADWWDRFATTSVSDIPHVHGGEATVSAGHVSQALGRWRELGAGSPGSASAELAFWRDHLENLHSPKAFALVVDTLLRKQDFRASMSLLMTWLSQVEQVPLEEGDFSFHQLALRWMLGVGALAATPDMLGATVQPGEKSPVPPVASLIVKFFDYLEANAEDFGQVPRLDLLGAGPDDGQDDKTRSDDDEESLFGAAYEDMTYKDSTDDDVDAEVLDFMPQKDFDLGHEAERLEKRLKFLATLARLWNVATRALREARGADHHQSQEAIAAWLSKARKNYHGLVALLDAIYEHDIPKPSGSYESLVEYDNRRITKERLLSVVITTCMDQALAVGALRGAREEKQERQGSGVGGQRSGVSGQESEGGSQEAEDSPGTPDSGPLTPGEAEVEGNRPGWESVVIRLERALLKGDPSLARAWLPEFIRQFKHEPLLYTPLSHGGHPRQILRASIAQTILRGLVANLPRQGLLRETYQLVLLAHAMEQTQSLTGPRVTEFDRLFQLAVQAVTEAVVDAGQRERIRPQTIALALEGVAEPFLKAWMDHSKTLRVAMLETVGNDKDWSRLTAFIKKYGHDLFHARFMTLANLRGILHRGVGPYLDYLCANPDPLHPIKLVEDLERGLARQEPERWLQIVLQAIVENYDHYRDYNTTTTQSDYGENLFQLFDFLRLKASYERNAWQLRPLSLVHEILARKLPAAADSWRQQAQELSRQTADEHLKELAGLEQLHGMRLATIADRVEERFVKPMALDSLCALVESALEQAPASLDSDAVVPLEEALTPFAATPAGVGLDVPHWILRLEGEVQRARTSKTALVSLAETLFQVPKVQAPFQELAEQLRDWKKAVV